MKNLFPFLFVLSLCSCSNTAENTSGQGSAEAICYFVEYGGDDSLREAVLTGLDSKCYCLSDLETVECYTGASHCFFLQGNKGEYLYTVKVKEFSENDSLFANIQIFDNRPDDTQRVLNAGDFNITGMNTFDKYESASETLIDLIVKLTFK